MRLQTFPHRKAKWLQAAIWLCVLALTGCSTSDRPQKNEASLDVLAHEALAFAQDRLRATAESLGGPPTYPRSTRDDGTWYTVSPHDWTSGFFPGLLWQMYEYTGEPYWEEQARTWTEGLEEQQYNTGTHDVGFMLYDSYGQGYRLTGDTSYVPVLLQGARSLASRFDPDVGATKSWDWSDEWDFPVIVDNMMNLELLFWAAEESGDARFRTMAVEHALTTAEHHVRPDGSTFHVVDFDPETGAVQERTTRQGYAPSSTWSRGQAWALYGFTMTYRETDDPRLLQTARETADYFIARLPDDYVPHWDFDVERTPETPRDVAAGAIAASGLLELSQFVGDDAEAERYYTAAIRILRALAREPYLAKGTDNPAILQHGTGDLPHDSEIDVALIYADYYFVEALQRYLTMQEKVE